MRDVGLSFCLSVSETESECAELQLSPPVLSSTFASSGVQGLGPTCMNVPLHLKAFITR